MIAKSTLGEQAKRKKEIANGTFQIERSQSRVRCGIIFGIKLVSLVMKTALASGMKNSLALVVKNGLRP